MYTSTIVAFTKHTIAGESIRAFDASTCHAIHGERRLCITGFRRCVAHCLHAGTCRSCRKYSYTQLTRTFHIFHVVQDQNEYKDSCLLFRRIYLPPSSHGLYPPRDLCLWGLRPAPAAKLYGVRFTKENEATRSLGRHALRRVVYDNVLVQAWKLPKKVPTRIVKLVHYSSSTVLVVQY